MKKILLSLLSLVVAMTMFAQSESVRKMNLIYDGQVVYSRHVSLIDSIKFIWEELAGDDVICGGEVDSTKQLYVGVVAFNQNVRQMAITSDIEAVKTFINEQTNDKDATAFAYSVSRGNQLFDAEALPAFDKIFMLNFSDGTDNYSNMLWGNDGRMVSQRNVYDTARYDLQQRPALNSYALGFGNDVGFGANMQKVVMGSGSYFNATAASELQSTFNEIAKSMLASAKNVLLKTNPGYYINGDCKYFRFSFVAEGGYADTIYAQMDGYPAIGYTLTISKIANGYAYFDAPAKGIMDDATGKVHIPLNNLKFIKDGEELQYKYEIEVSFDGELYYEDVEEASTSEEIDKRIAVVLVLDCSTSMGDAFEPMKAAAVNFIETMEKMEVETPVEPETPEVPEGVITCAEAVAICYETGSTSTTESYTIQGYVTEIKTVWSEQYGNITFWMADTQNGGQVLLAYRVKPILEGEENVKVGDKVEVKGTLVNYYDNTPQVNAGGTYTILVAAEGGETPDTPVEPEEPETPTGEPLADGYAKVTNMATLADGDKVVLYCDAYAVGVTGFDGYKSATMGEAAWVEYVVETVEGGIMLKDEDQYISLTVKNSFKYNAAGSVLTVTENAMLSAYLEADAKTYFLYRNANTNYGNAFCRMYTDKSGNDEYAPFYVYEVTEKTGEGEDPVEPNPGTPDTPEEPETPSVETVGDGTEANPFTVEDVIALNNTLSGKQYVKAYIVGQVNGAALAAGAEFEAPFTPSTNSTTGVQNTYNTNLLIASSADETDPAKCVPVQLPSGDVRTNFNLPENPDMDGKLVLINGDLIKYFTVPGIKNTVSITIVNR